MKFIYPVGDGTRDTFEKEWYVTLGFGDKTDYGYHEGIDINLKTGGDSDHGQPLYAISDWKIEYYHNSHSETGFGVHHVYSVESPWGKRWIHQAHTMKPLDWTKEASGKVGQKLAELDKTGRPRQSLVAHLHLTVFKKDPAGLPNKIDSIFKTKTELNEWCEDPIELFKKWYDYKEDNMDIRQLATDLRMGLLGTSPSKDELDYDVEHWENPKAFIERITGDGNFYKKYITPQLENQKLALDSSCNTEKQSILDLKQSEIETAKKDLDNLKVEYEKKLVLKVENYDTLTLLKLGIEKLLGIKKG